MEFYLEIRGNNCFCNEVCGECKQWFDCTEEVVYYKVADEERILICSSCFPKLTGELRDRSIR